MTTESSLFALMRIPAQVGFAIAIVISVAASTTGLDPAGTGREAVRDDAEVRALEHLEEALVVLRGVVVAHDIHCVRERRHRHRARW